MECNWNGFIEPESQVDHYMFGIGKAEGDDDVFTFLRLDGSMTSFRAKGTDPTCIRVKLCVHDQMLALSRY